MKLLEVNYQQAITEQQIKQTAHLLVAHLEHIRESLKNGYNTDYAALFLPEDTQLIATIQTAITAKKLLKPDILVLIAIGGSNLGTIAVFQAVAGLFYNQLDHNMRFYYADTVDTRLTAELLTIVENALQKKQKIVLNIVTKSGKTTETLINAAFFVELLKKYYPDNYQQWIVVTTDKDSPVWNIAQDYGYTLLEVPRNVGGRYSVLSAVGLFPLGLLGVDIRELQAGALQMRDSCLQSDGTENSALKSAITIFLHYQMGKNIHDTFIFEPSLAQLGFWYRQLVGESLGKREHQSQTTLGSDQGSLEQVGITPTVSVGTRDLHSVAQLYLNGPHDKLTTFISVCDKQPPLIIPTNEFTQPILFVQDKPVAVITRAILESVKEAYAHEKLPFISIGFQELTAHSLGQFLMLKMCEVIYTAYLLGVNPFDQPAVELYKSRTRKILTHD